MERTAISFRAQYGLETRMADSRITSRMKVYRTRIGFHDWIVAANSQKAALKAWDLHNNNLFASGAARVVNNPADVELAMKTPGIPVIAPGQDKIRVPDVAPKPVKKQPKAENRHVEKALPPDRSRLDAAEKELAKFEKKAAARRASLNDRRKALQAEIEDFEAEAARERRRLEQRIAKERKAL